jgi:hypothetical protein
MASLELLKRGQGQHVNQLVTKTSLKVMYKDVSLRGLIVLQGLPSNWRKKNFSLHAVRLLEEQFFNQGKIVRSTAVFDTFTWPIGITLEDYIV